MIKRLTQSLVVIMFLLVIFDVTTSNGVEATEENVSAIAGAIDISWPTEDELTLVDTDTMIVGEPVEEEEPELTELDSELYLQYQKMGYTEEEFLDDLELLACITLAEAGNQSEYGKRLVIDTVLNRIDSPCWRDDDTIREAITHPSQYTTYSNQAYTYQEMNEDGLGADWHPSKKTHEKLAKLVAEKISEILESDLLRYYQDMESFITDFDNLKFFV